MKLIKLDKSAWNLEAVRQSAHNMQFLHKNS